MYSSQNESTARLQKIYETYRATAQRCTDGIIRCEPIWYGQNRTEFGKKLEALGHNKLNNFILYTPENMSDLLFSIYDDIENSKGMVLTSTVDLSERTLQIAAKENLQADEILSQFHTDLSNLYASEQGFDSINDYFRENQQQLNEFLAYYKETGEYLTYNETSPDRIDDIPETHIEEPEIAEVSETAEIPSKSLENKTLNINPESTIKHNNPKIETRKLGSEAGEAIEKGIKDISKIKLGKGAKIGLAVASAIIGASIIRNGNQNRVSVNREKREKYDYSAMHTAEQISSFSYNKPYRPH